MKENLISILRDQSTEVGDFRSAVRKLGAILAIEVSHLLAKEGYTVRTPISEAKGMKYLNKVVLIPILRSGMALLESFISFYPKAPVGFIGVYRDESTAHPFHYYHKLPHISSSDEVVILEPMLATGGSLSLCIQLLIEHGVREDKLIIASVIAAPEGYNKIMQQFPKLRIVIAQMDEGLNAKKFITPGLGDFGDRYFGTL